MSNNTYTPIYHPIEAQGTLTINVKAQPKREGWIQEIIDTQLRDGQGAPKSLRYQCRIALDTGAALEDFVSDLPLSINPSSKPQFGESATGLPYLSFGLVTDSGDRIQVKWEGDDVPKKLVEAAVKHDQGKATRAFTYELDFAKAKVYEVTKKPKNQDQRTNHKLPHHPSAARNYNRCSVATLAKV